MEAIMKAWAFDQFGSNERLYMTDIATAEPKENEIQVRLMYAGVNPVDWKIRDGYLKDVMPYEFPIIPGWDGAGVVTRCGTAVRDFKVGDEVFGYFRTNIVKAGTFAEYACAPEIGFTKKPSSMSFAVAAALPIASLTAWQALFEFAKITPKMSVLILGGAGGVGSMGVQFAHWKGATVITTASLKNHDYVRSLGADFAIDYKAEDVQKKLFSHCEDGVDVVLDCVGGNTCKESIPLIKKGGCLVSIVDFEAEQYASDGLRAGFIFCYPNGNQLREIAELITQGKIKAPEISEFPFQEAKKALELSEQGHTRGKIVLKI